MVRKAISILLALLCIACSAIRVDVEVYTGPISNTETVQVEQMAAVLESAELLLASLRDSLEDSARRKQDARLIFNEQSALKNVSNWFCKLVGYELKPSPMFKPIRESSSYSERYIFARSNGFFKSEPARLVNELLKVYRQTDLSLSSESQYAWFRQVIDDSDSRITWRIENHILSTPSRDVAEVSLYLESLGYLVWDEDDEPAQAEIIDRLEEIFSEDFLSGAIKDQTIDEFNEIKKDQIHSIYLTDISAGGSSEDFDSWFNVMIGEPVTLILGSDKDAWKSENVFSKRGLSILATYSSYSRESQILTVSEDWARSHVSEFRGKMEEFSEWLSMFRDERAGTLDLSIAIRRWREGPASPFDETGELTPEASDLIRVSARFGERLAVIASLNVMQTADREQLQLVEAIGNSLRNMADEMLTRESYGLAQRRRSDFVERAIEEQLGEEFFDELSRSFESGSRQSIEIESTNKNSIDHKVVVGSRKRPPSDRRNASLVSGTALPTDLLDNLILKLRLAEAHALAHDKAPPSGDHIARLRRAIALLAQHRSGMSFLRPASAYLRSATPATALRSNDIKDRNLLLDAAGQVKHRSAVREVNGESTRIAESLDALYWQNINSVRVSGFGKTTFALVRDDVGNWYVRGYSTDVDEMYESMSSVALFGASTDMREQMVSGLSEDEAGGKASQASQQLEAVEAVFVEQDLRAYLEFASEVMDWNSSLGSQLELVNTNLRNDGGSNWGLLTREPGKPGSSISWKEDVELGIDGLIARWEKEETVAARDDFLSARNVLSVARAARTQCLEWRRVIMLAGADSKASMSAADVSKSHALLNSELVDPILEKLKDRRDQVLLQETTFEAVKVGFVAPGVE